MDELLCLTNLYPKSIEEQKDRKPYYYYLKLVEKNNIFVKDKLFNICRTFCRENELKQIDEDIIKNYDYNNRESQIFEKDTIEINSFDICENCTQYLVNDPYYQQFNFKYIQNKFYEINGGGTQDLICDICGQDNIVMFRDETTTLAYEKENEKEVVVDIIAKFGQSEIDKFAFDQVYLKFARCLVFCNSNEDENIKEIKTIYENSITTENIIKEAKSNCFVKTETEKEQLTKTSLFINKLKETQEQLYNNINKNINNNNEEEIDIINICHPCWKTLCALDSNINLNSNLNLHLYNNYDFEKLALRIYEKDKNLPLQCLYCKKYVKDLWDKKQTTKYILLFRI